jgi:hypothetical protein
MTRTWQCSICPRNYNALRETSEGKVLYEMAAIPSINGRGENKRNLIIVVWVEPAYSSSVMLARGGGGDDFAGVKQ